MIELFIEFLWIIDIIPDHSDKMESDTKMRVVTFLFEIVTNQLIDDVEWNFLTHCIFKPVWNRHFWGSDDRR